jgi:hypothetical protein
LSLGGAGASGAIGLIADSIVDLAGLMRDYAESISTKRWSLYAKKLPQNPALDSVRAVRPPEQIGKFGRSRVVNSIVSSINFDYVVLVSS